MKKSTLLFLLIFIFGISAAFAQNSDSPHEMNQLFSKNLKYPTEARRLNAQETVVVSINVDKEGVITDEVEILSGENEQLRTEVLRVIQLVGDKWDPSFLTDHKAGEDYLLTIQFKLHGQNDTGERFNSVAHRLKDLPELLNEINEKIEQNPFSSQLYLFRAEIYLDMGEKVRAEMDANQAEFLKKKTLSEIVVVGYGAVKKASTI
ncbi:energy transducer TonB [Algoriphagus chordae]|nr:energy transducer TonB [Algoriphagus chordae]